MHRKENTIDLWCAIWNYRSLNAPVSEKFLKAYLNRTDADLSAENPDGSTLIQLAASTGHWDIVKIISDRKITNLKYTDVLFSALEAHKPPEKDLSEVITSLIKAGASLSAEKNGKTPIQMAYDLQKPDCAEIIGNLARDEYPECLESVNEKPVSKEDLELSALKDKRDKLVKELLRDYVDIVMQIPAFYPVSTDKISLGNHKNTLFTNSLSVNGESEEKRVQQVGRFLSPKG